jgi:DNA-directed RNA polymerase II subunit RPB1
MYEYKDGKYQPIDQYILISDGSNFLDVLTHPDVDPTRIVSSNIHDMMENLGIEATRATLFKEITTLFTESGTGVNYRHISVLIDKMCHKGRVMSVDRYGINKNDIGPLAKMSFEQTAEIALNAAEFGERDPCLGISAKVMLGAPIKAGTGFSELLFDEASAIKLATSTPEQRPSPARGPGGYTDDDMDEALYGEDDDDECAVENIHMHVAMPAAPEDIIQEDIDEDIEISIVP